MVNRIRAMTAKCAPFPALMGLNHLVFDFNSNSLTDAADLYNADSLVRQGLRAIRVTLALCR